MRTAIALVGLALAACEPARVAIARYPGAPAAFDRAGADPQALAVADRAIAAAGGAAAWAAVRQLSWHLHLVQSDGSIVEADEAWDRWNARAHFRVQIGGDTDAIVKRDLYGTFRSVTAAVGRHVRSVVERDRKPLLDGATRRWRFDTAELCAPFLLEEPGSRIAYAGEEVTGGGLADIIAVTFDPRDAARAGDVLHVIVAQDTGVVVRLEIERDGATIGYALSGWTTVAGIRVPALARNDVSGGEVAAFGAIAIGEPDGELYSSDLP